MKNVVIHRVLLILFVFLMMSVPVNAQELDGNADTTAVGQTAVTARVEMPVDESEDSKESGAVKTGDDRKLVICILLLVISTTILVRCVFKKEW